MRCVEGRFAGFACGSRYVEQVRWMSPVGITCRRRGGILEKCKGPDDPYCGCSLSALEDEEIPDLV